MRNKSLKKAVHITMLGCLLSPAAGISATTEDLERRLQKLEEELKATKEEIKTTNDEIADSAERGKNAMTVAGYADIEYVGTDRPATKSGFRIHHLSLMLKKQVRENLKFFSEIEFEDAAYLSSSATTAATTGSGKILVEAVNFDYALNHATTARVGRFFTPAGIWSVDHYPPFVATQDRPQHIRLIFPQVTDGASLSGNHEVGASFVNYNLFVGNGESFVAGSNTAIFNGAADQNSSTAVGLRVNASLPIAKQFEVGATLYRDQLVNTDQATKNAYGIHAKMKAGDFGFQGEYADGSYNPTVGATIGQVYHRKGYYGQFSYDINKWTLGYRYDFYDPSSVVALDNTKINSLIANYHVDKNTVLKWEHHLLNLENPASTDYYRSIASIVVNFD